MRSTGHGELIETRSIPSVPYRYPENIWDYQPAEGPFRFELHGNVVDSPLKMFETWSTFESAVERFVDKAIPLWYPAYAFILDSTSTVVLGYDTTPVAVAKRGPYGFWFGVRAGFEMLEQFYDPMEAAVWEIQAKEVVW